MKILFRFVLFALLVSGCNAPFSNGDPVSYLHDGLAVIQTDKAFNSYCQVHGRTDAFIAFADSAAIQVREGALPLRGLSELSGYYQKKNDRTNNLSWEPEKGYSCGDLGYTFGWWKFKAKTAAGADTVYQGNYITVWKKQKNGDWKFVVDGGNNTPSRPALKPVN